jgi:tetratricopeptide (TPR) repeat protein
MAKLGWLILIVSFAHVAGAAATPAQSTAASTASSQSTATTTPPRTIYLEGKVKADDGRSLPEPAAIERICNGIVYREGHADSRGDFGLQIGAQNSSTFLDASAGFDKAPALGTQGSGSQVGLSERDLAGCEIRANVPGYVSDSIILGFRRVLDNPNVGTIYLHALSRDENYISSVTTVMAPKKAASDYEKGVQSLKKQQWAEAERHFSSAVRDYPKYAIAWFELGRLLQKQNKLEEAIHAYREAVDADAEFAGPYAQLAVISAARGEWEDTVRYTSRLIMLEPGVSSPFYFYSAVGNHYLRNSALALEHAREAARLDPQHQNPKIDHLMGVLLAEKGDNREAAEYLRMYLKLMPSAPDAEAVREQLAELEKMERGL